MEARKAELLRRIDSDREVLLDFSRGSIRIHIRPRGEKHSQALGVRGRVSKHAWRPCNVKRRHHDVP